MCGKKHGHKEDTNPDLPWGALSSQCLTGTWFLILCFSSHSHQLKIENWAQASISRVVLDWYAEEAYWLDTRPDWGMQRDAKLCSPPLSSPTMFGLVWRRNPGDSQVTILVRCLANIDSARKCQWLESQEWHLGRYQRAKEKERWYWCQSVSPGSPPASLFYWPSGWGQIFNLPEP